MEPVSKELFTTEIKYVKSSVSDIKTDIRYLKDIIHDLSTNIAKIESHHIVTDNKFQHVEDNIGRVANGLDKTSEVLDKVCSRLNDMNVELESIKKYPVYTKWTFGIFLSILLIYRYIKNL